MEPRRVPAAAAEDDGGPLGDGAAPVRGRHGRRPESPSRADRASCSSETSKRSDDAWKLIEFLSEPAQQVRFYALAGDLPARRDAWKDPLLAGDAAARAFEEQLHHVVATPRVPEWEQVAQKVAEHLEPAIRGVATVDEALASLDQDVSTFSSRNAAGCSRGRLSMRAEIRRGARAEVRAALFFLAPGLFVIVVFFFLPIAASLLLSATDFDLYALADSANVRVTGPRELSRRSPRTRSSSPR